MTDEDRQNFLERTAGHLNFYAKRQRNTESKKSLEEKAELITNVLIPLVKKERKQCSNCKHGEECSYHHGFVGEEPCTDKNLWKPDEGVVVLTKEDIENAQKITCYNSLGFCCGLEKECVFRDSARATLDVTDEEFNSKREWALNLLMVKK